MIDLLQWPAMAASLFAAWLLASPAPRRRHAGFWIFLASNALWITWGWSTSAYALVALQVGLALLNWRGLSKTATAAESG
jgi:hypothetical protein